MCYQWSQENYSIMRVFLGDYACPTLEKLPHTERILGVQYPSCLLVSVVFHPVAHLVPWTCQETCPVGLAVHVKLTMYQRSGPARPVVGWLDVLAS